jgi:outer membrane protein assembly factor BamB
MIASPLCRAALWAALLPLSLAQADDWPEFQGAGRQNIWNETGLRASFGPNDLSRVWSAPVGPGYSGPTVAGAGVYLMDRPDRERERVACFDRATGKPLWEHAYECRYEKIGYDHGPRAGVTIADGRAYSLGTMGNLHCLDAKTGAVIWAKNLATDYKIDMPIWGLTSSPLVEGDTVIVQAAAPADGACIVAFEKMTGKEKWRAFNDKAGYVSPIMIEQAGQRVLVAWTAQRIAGLDAATGRVYWEVPTKPTKMPINVPGPALSEDGSRLFLSVFYDGAKMLRLDREKPGAELLWARAGINERTTDALHAMISPPFVRDGHIYGIDSYGQMRCLAAETGERIWEDGRAVPNGRWATVFMVRQGQKSERVWMVTELGELILAKLTPAGYEEISRAKLLDPATPLPQRPNGAVNWAPPAFADQSVYLKNDRELIRVSLAAE